MFTPCQENVHGLNLIEEALTACWLPERGWVLGILIGMDGGCGRGEWLSPLPSPAARVPLRVLSRTHHLESEFKSCWFLRIFHSAKWQ